MKFPEQASALSRGLVRMWLGAAWTGIAATLLFCVQLIWLLSRGASFDSAMRATPLGWAVVAAAAALLLLRIAAARSLRRDGAMPGTAS